MGTDATSGSPDQGRIRNPDHLVILSPVTSGEGADQALSWQALRQEIVSGAVFRRFFAYRSVYLIAPHVYAFPRSALTRVLARLFCRGTCRILTPSGQTDLVWRGVPGECLRLLGGEVLAPLIRLALARKARRLGVRQIRSSSIRPGSPPVYIRADLELTRSWGGMMSHVTGVICGLDRVCGSLTVLATAMPSDLPPSVRTVGLPIPVWGWDVAELAPMIQGLRSASAAYRLLPDRDCGFVYQRNQPFSLAGLELARRVGRPFVVEYNGSEVWIARHWAGGVRYEGLAAAVEQANLSGADLVVTVSDVLRQDVISRGIAPERVLVVPNGVDTDRFSPDIDGAGVRRRLGLEGRLVVGFSGSFGPWHGADVLARAFRAAFEARPDLPLTLLFLGDGERKAAAAAVLSGSPAAAALIEAGVIPFDEMPAHLAACDILVSPQIQNPDGTAFFGSPTKLFEYMAVGRPVIASALTQMADILRDGETALLVPAGDDAALSAAVIRLAEDPGLRRSLADRARKQVLERHTWDQHVRHILRRLSELCP